MLCWHSRVEGWCWLWTQSVHCTALDTNGQQILFLIPCKLQISDSAMTVNIGLHCLANGSAKTHYFKYGPILLSSEWWPAMPAPTPSHQPVLQPRMSSCLIYLLLIIVSVVSWHPHKFPFQASKLWLEGMVTKSSFENIPRELSQPGFI